MPEMIVWPVSGSVETRNDGSSRSRRSSAWPSLSMSALVLGSIAIEITGSGNSRDSRIRMGAFCAQSVSPVDDVLEADRGNDVAGVDLLELLPLVRVHLSRRRPRRSLLAARRR